MFAAKLFLRSEIELGCSSFFFGGIDLTEEDIRNWYIVLSGLAPGGKTSMLQDIEAGRKTEVEMFAGKVMELGRRCNIPTPANEKLFRLIKDIEQGQHIGNSPFPC